jgi:TerC family integral membrane protein
MTTAQLTPWVVFLVGVAALLILDIGVLSRRNATMTTRSALIWSAVWISLGLSFSLAVWAWRGGVAAQEYLAGYLIEESLSIDNLFVFMIVFGSLGIALRNQRKVLFWGIFGAIVLRGVFILVGVSILERFEWVIYLFGALLVFTAYRLIRSHGVQVDPERNPMVRVARRLFPIDIDYEGNDFDKGLHHGRRKSKRSTIWAEPSRRSQVRAPNTSTRRVAPSRYTSVTCRWVIGAVARNRRESQSETSSGQNECWPLPRNCSSRRATAAGVS